MKTAADDSQDILMKCRSIYLLPTERALVLLRLTFEEANSPISPVDSFPLAVVFGDNGAQTLNHILCTTISTFIVSTVYVRAWIFVSSARFLTGGIKDTKRIQSILRGALDHKASLCHLPELPSPDVPII